MSKVRPERAPGSTSQKIDESTYQDEWKLYNPFAKTIQRKSYGLLVIFSKMPLRNVSRKSAEDTIENTDF